MVSNKGVRIESNKIYNLKETAGLLGVKKRTLTNLAEPLGKRIGKRYLFSGQNIINYLGTVSPEQVAQDKT